MSTPAANVTNTSGTYNFAPSLGETVLYSFGLCGVRATALTQSHFETARMAANLMMSAWSARGVNLWQVDSQQITLQQGCSTYQVPSNTIVMLDMYITHTTGIDRVVMPISRTEYANFPNKQQQGFPNCAWFDRLLSPTVTLWPVPDSTVKCLHYYRLRQSQDSILGNGASIEIPTYFWDAFALGLAWRLALTWAPAQAPMLKPLADEAYNFAATQNVESSNYYLAPMIGGYFR
jgi:hypothetical protein